MGIEDARDYANIDYSGDTTLEELVAEFGPEAVRRGLAYMESLHEAEQEYVSSKDEDNYEKGLRDVGVEGDLDEASDKWADSMEDSGLNLYDNE